MMDIILIPQDRSAIIPLQQKARIGKRLHFMIYLYPLIWPLTTSRAALNNASYLCGTIDSAAKRAESEFAVPLPWSWWFCDGAGPQL
jgi:hypothetical protein